METIFLIIFGFFPFFILVGVIFFKVSANIRYDYFEPLTFVLFTTLLGVTLRTLYIPFADSESYYHLLRYRPQSILIGGLLVICLGLIFLVAGYLLGHTIQPIKLINPSWFGKYQWNMRLTYYFVWFFCALSLIGIYLVIDATGISFDSVYDISRKRALIQEGTRIVFGYRRWLSEFGSYAFLISSLILISSGKKLFSKWGLLFVISGIIASIPPILYSERNKFVIFSIYIIMLWYYFGYSKSKIIKLPLLKIIPIIIFVFFMIMVLTAFRTGINEFNEISDYLTVSMFIDRVVGSGNFFGVEKVAIIVEEVPRYSGFLNGQSFYTWIIAPIPRSIWPSKPQTSLGYLFGEIFFYRDFTNIRGGGRPPGFMVELYWNFGLFGVVFGMFLYGLFLAIYYRYFQKYLRNKNKNMILVYIMTVIPLTITLLGSNFNRTIIDLARNLIVLNAVLNFISSSHKNKKVVNVDHS